MAGKRRIIKSLGDSGCGLEAVSVFVRKDFWKLGKTLLLVFSVLEEIRSEYLLNSHAYPCYYT
jgi:hypothetical protein